ncbi:hypothetical protein [Mycobacterium antarcticum]|uniref:hypothetical protein n=1 Tax=Mycolicibacterium sp. TUM20984 TaxID=3023368 RepID=UPI0024E07166|nr:hypothetical protein [Mycolicibacterium sp. TUM20984]
MVHIVGPTRTSSATHTVLGRDGWVSELEAIAAAFIGGASASGGVGTVLGAIIGGRPSTRLAGDRAVTRQEDSVPGSGSLRPAIVV